MPFPKKGHSHHARTHSEARASLCSVCLRTKRVRLAKPDTEKLIQKFISPLYSLKKNNLPAGICQTCRRILLAHQKVLNVNKFEM